MEQKIECNCVFDPCIYYMIDEHIIFFVAVYVDDLLLFSNNDDFKILVKSHLMKKFVMKDLGVASCCVGLRIRRDRKNGIIYVDQETYSKEILARFNMTDCKPVFTPADENTKLLKSSKIVEDNIPYQEAVGSLLYLAQGTRPDLAYAINYVSKFNNCYDQSHWKSIKRIFRYLQNTLNYKLKFVKDT